MLPAVSPRPRQPRQRMQPLMESGTDQGTLPRDTLQIQAERQHGAFVHAATAVAALRPPVSEPPKVLAWIADVKPAAPSPRPASLQPAKSPAAVRQSTANQASVNSQSTVSRVAAGNIVCHKTAYPAISEMRAQPQRATQAPSSRLSSDHARLDLPPCGIDSDDTSGGSDLSPRSQTYHGMSPRSMIEDAVHWA